MHLTIVSPFPPAITGIGQYGYHVTRALAKSGAFSRLTVLAGSPEETVHPNHLGLTEIEYCWQPGQFNARQAVLARLKRLHPDLVWFNLGASVFGKSPLVNLSGLLTPMYAQRLGFPTVVTLHELVELADLRALDAPGGPFAVWGARLLTNITTRADMLCLTMNQYAEWLTKRQLDCMHIPIGAYHEPELLPDSNSQELLFFTTLAPFKGLELLLRAFRALRTKYPRLRLTIAGAQHVRFPNYGRELKRSFNGTEGVQWLGQVPEDEVMGLFQRAQIVVLPYAASTGSSSVLYQAATWGRPVVASDLKEIRALVDESNLKIGFFQNNSLEGLCSAIRSLLDSSEKRQAQATHNFNAMQRTRPEETTARYIEAFNRALEKRRSPKRIEIPARRAKPGMIPDTPPNHQEASGMIPRRVRLAVLIAFLLHGLFILTARYRLSYDAYTHMLFANHYAEHWFSLWEPRWYTGFTVVSYPPLTHQIIAVFMPMLGFDAAYALVLWMVTTLYPLGIYSFCKIFIGKAAAGYAALASALFLPLCVTAYIFGQLPFLLGTLLSLFGAASLNRYLHKGGVYNLLLTVSLFTTTIASHHAVLLLQPFLFLAVVVNWGSRYAHRTERSGRLDQQVGNHSLRGAASAWSVFLSRIFLFGVLALLCGFIVIWPFWTWGMGQSMQTPIDHLSRHNFFTDPFAQVIFFWPLYGPFVVIVPFLFRRWPRRFVGLLASIAILFLLGLGGTTPLPRLFFGAAWEWLTYDRFAFWASLFLTPFFGILFIRLRHRWKNHSIQLPRLGYSIKRRAFLTFLTFAIFALTALGAWVSPLIFPTQPKVIDMQPIVDFLNAGDNSQWRYLTFGFGDQFARLNLLTQATTLDGSYHTARTLPELRESGIGQIDTAYWTLQGLPATIPILQKSGEYGVRWGFVNPAILQTTPSGKNIIRHNPFVPFLEAQGWVKVDTLTNGILVYENPKASLPTPSAPPKENSFASFSWGVFPMLSLVAALSLASLRLYPIRAEKVLRVLHASFVGLMPISLCFWYFRTVGEFSHPGVYFTYDNALFFLSDALALLAVVLWGTTLSLRGAAPLAPRRSNLLRTNRYSSPFLISVTFLLLASLSILWSSDWRTSLYIALHFWLIFLLILSLRDWNGSWKAAMFGLCAALSIEIVAGLVGFVSQSTDFLSPLKMIWPGLLNPSLRGASVVELSNGLRILRAYGTLPHPNILGGLVLIGLLGPASFFLLNKKPNYAALLLSIPGMAVLALSFSRAAWLGWIAFGCILLWKSKYLDRKRVLIFLAISFLSFIFTLLPYRQLVAARTVDTTSHSEEFSFIGRAWLNGQAIQMMKEHPLTGVGLGSFILQLAERAGEGYVIEPAHNIFLMAGAELGLPGLLILLTLTFFFAYALFKTQNGHAILAGATVTGLGVISLFDHYLWTLAPGRMLLGLALGLWAGQVRHVDG